MDALLPFPPPFAAWLTLSSDPDHTAETDWRALHQCIWEELELPFADSIFLRNANSTLPDQVCAETHPELLSAHPFDTLHTWGDYILSKTEVFTRRHAEDAVRVLSEQGAVPRVWIDHSFFQGNLVKSPRLGGLPEIQDASGLRYENPFYSLDLAHRAGVRYVWDGEIRKATSRPGESLSRQDYYAARNGNRTVGALLAAADRVGKPLWNWLQSQRFDYTEESTRLYYPMRFPDGRSLYAFWRYGSWELADITGLGTLLGAAELDALTAAGAACIVYSHLGKRNANADASGPHIPDGTRRALEDVRGRFERKEMMLSSVSDLLDYSVLRDHAQVNGRRIDFRSDSIRFPSLSPGDLANHTFGVTTTAERRAENLEVFCDGQPISAQVQNEAKGCLAFGVEAGAERRGQPPR